MNVDSVASGKRSGGTGRGNCSEKALFHAVQEPRLPECFEVSTECQASIVEMGSLNFIDYKCEQT